MAAATVTDEIDDQLIISDDAGGFGFQVTPTSMTMQMHMVGAMYAPSDRYTLVAMLPLVFKDMDHRTRAGSIFTTRSGGLGDLKLAAMVGLLDWDRQAVHVNLGVNVPTGSVGESDALPTSSGTEVQLPYPMQTGSGT